jgi:hypothetical protein
VCADGGRPGAIAGTRAVGTRIALAGLRNSEGAYFTDPAQPIGDVDVDIAFALIGAGHVFDLREQQAPLIIVAPYAQGDITADSTDVPVSEGLHGLVDAGISPQEAFDWDAPRLN